MYLTYASSSQRFVIEVKKQVTELGIVEKLFTYNILHHRAGQRIQLVLHDRQFTSVLRGEYVYPCRYNLSGLYIKSLQLGYDISKDCAAPFVQPFEFFVLFHIR